MPGLTRRQNAFWHETRPRAVARAQFLFSARLRIEQPTVQSGSAHSPGWIGSSGAGVGSGGWDPRAASLPGSALALLVLVRQEVLEPPTLGVVREAERDADAWHDAPCRFLLTHDLGFQRDLVLTYPQEKLKMSARG